ncbi:hypothetical protein M378DRAFT_174091, partial [Amanita muscaria Koide BX008]
MPVRAESKDKTVAGGLGAMAEYVTWQGRLQEETRGQQEEEGWRSVSKEKTTPGDAQAVPVVSELELPRPKKRLVMAPGVTKLAKKGV